MSDEQSGMTVGSLVAEIGRTAIHVMVTLLINTIILACVVGGTCAAVILTMMVMVEGWVCQ